MITLATIVTQFLPLYLNIFFYISLALILIILILHLKYNKKLKQKNIEHTQIQQQNIAKIDSIYNEHTNSLENIRKEMLRREDEKNRLWENSEKETLHVLAGVSNILDLTDKLNNAESNKIIELINEINNKIDDDKQNKKTRRNK
jgi:hypothetical protein